MSLQFDSDLALRQTAKTDQYLGLYPDWPESNRILNAREENLVETLQLSYIDLEAIYNSGALENMEHPHRIKEAILRILK